MVSFRFVFIIFDGAKTFDWTSNAYYGMHQLCFLSWSLDCQYMHQQPLYITFSLNKWTVWRKWLAGENLWISSIRGPRKVACNASRNWFFWWWITCKRGNGIENHRWQWQIRYFPSLENINWLCFPDICLRLDLPKFKEGQLMICLWHSLIFG